MKAAYAKFEQISELAILGLVGVVATQRATILLLILLTAIFHIMIQNLT